MFLWMAGSVLIMARCGRISWLGDLNNPVTFWGGLILGLAGTAMYGGVLLGLYLLIE